MVEIIFFLFAFLFVVAFLIVVSFTIGYYGLKLIDKTEQWYKGQNKTDDKQ